MPEEKTAINVPTIPYIETGAARELSKAIVGKTALLREVLNTAVSGKLAGASIAEVFKGAVANGGCGFGCF